MSQNLPLLARYAESLFWMARYLERVENLARLIDVTQTFESPGREAEAWYALVRINANEEEFAKLGNAPDPESVKRFYLLDRDNPSSIPSLDRCGAAERPHAATADLHRDVDAAQHVPSRRRGDHRRTS